MGHHWWLGFKKNFKKKFFCIFYDCLKDSKYTNSQFCTF